MQLSQKIIDAGLKFVYPFIYFGQWNKDKIIYHIDNCKFKVRVGTSDKIAIWEIFNKKEYTDENNFKIKSSDIVVDIGGHIGAFTVFAAKQAKQVYAYEALKGNYDLLNENIELNNLKNVRSFNVAVSDKIGEEEFFIAKGNVGGSSLYKTTYSKHKIKVPTITLKEIFSANNLERINFLKIDAEGAEYKILLNTPKSLLCKIDKIALEFHDNIREHGHNYKELIKLFKDNSFYVNVPTSFLIRILFKLGRIKAIRFNCHI